VIRRTVYLMEGNEVTATELRRFGSEWGSESSTATESLIDLPLKDAGERALERFQREYCVALLNRCGGDLNAASERAGYTRKGMRELLRRLGLG
jgi:DNA-binding NtrC family response regulator